MLPDGLRGAGKTIHFEPPDAFLAENMQRFPGLDPDFILQICFEHPDRFGLVAVGLTILLAVGGPAQVGYRVQVDRTTAFDAPVIDVSAASPDAFCSLDLPACGDYCVRVKVQTGPATWTGWRLQTLDSKTRVVYRETLREPPGTITFAWPGIIVRSAECPISFVAQLATPGHYFLVAAATLEGHPGLIDGTQVEFVVTW